MREKLIEILRVPIFPHELSDPTEAVADYLLDNDVVPVVRCKDCRWRKERGLCYMISGTGVGTGTGDDFYCSYGERKNNDFT